MRIAREILTYSGFSNITESKSVEPSFIVGEFDLVKLTIIYYQKENKFECDITSVDPLFATRYNDIPTMMFNKSGGIESYLYAVIRIAISQNRMINRAKKQKKYFRN